MKLVVRPVASALGPESAIAALGSLVFVAAAATKMSGWALGATVAACLCIFVAMIGYRVSAMRRSALCWDGQTVSFRGALGRVRQVATAGNGRVVRVEAVKAPGKHMQLWLDSEGGCNLVLSEAAWDVAQLDDLRRAVRLDFEVHAEALTAKQIRATYPGSVPLAAAHPVATGVLLTVFLVIAAVVL